MATRDAFVLVIDVGQTMKEEMPGLENTSRFDFTKQLLWKLVQQKIIISTGKKLHRFGVVIFNSNATENPLNDEEGGYPHIQVLYDLNGGAAKLEHLETIDNLKPQKGKADPVDAILVAAKLFEACTKSYERRIFMISDFSGEIADQDQHETIAEGLNENKVQLTTIGIGFQNEEEEKPQSTKPGEQPRPEAEDLRTPLQKANEKVMEKFISNVAEGSKVTAQQSFRQVHEFRKSKFVNARAKKMTLDISQSEKPLHICIWGRTKKASLPGLKKRSKLGEETRKVRQERLYKNKKGDVDEIVDNSEKIRSFKYGSQRIPMDNPTHEKSRWREDISMKVIGFVHQSDVPQHNYMGEASIVTAGDGDEHGQLGLSALIRACQETSSCGLVRYVKSRSSAPKLYVLVPRVKESMECFIMNEIPYLEDVRNFSFNSFEDVKIEQEQLDAAKKLVRSLDLMTSGVDDDGSACEALRPVDTFNPIILRTYESITNRALDPSAKIQDFSDEIKKYLCPDKALFDRNAETVSNFACMFNLTRKEVKEKSKKRKRGDEMDSLFDLLNNDAKRQKKEEDADDDFNLDDLDLGLDVDDVKKIGTKTPIQDFDAILNKRDDPNLWERVHDEMWTIIAELVKKSFKGDRDQIALDSLKHLRKKAIKEEEPKQFNSKFKKFKLDYKQDFEEMWKKIEESGVSLIHKDDFEEGEAPSDLETTEEDSKKFLKGDEPVPVSLPTVVEEDDDDALFDDLL